jgi:hypothetical protein
MKKREYCCYKCQYQNGCNKPLVCPVGNFDNFDYNHEV